MAKGHATIKISKRLYLQMKLMPLFVHIINCFSPKKAQTILDWYLNYVEENIGKYVKVTY